MSCRLPEDSQSLTLRARNAPDFASRASHPGAAVWPQLIAMPLGFSLVSFIGIIVSSSSTVIFGEAVWNPIDLLNAFLDSSPSHATRFGVRLRMVGRKW
jgi:NCS1 family nucleobase:cation symporter-1